MFESDDWELDEDFLNDVDTKATQYYSQIQNDSEADSTKKRRVETIDNCVLPSTRLSNENENSKKKYGQNASTGAEKSSRKNLILGILNKNCIKENASGDTSANSQTSASNVTANSLQKPLCCNHNSQQLRKNLVLDILKKEDSGGKILQKDQKLLTNIKDTKTQHLKSKPASINNTGNEKQKTEMKSNEEKCSTLNSNSKESCLKILSKRSNTANTIDNRRTQLLLNAMKPSSVNSTQHTENIKKPSNFPVKTSQVQTNKKMTLIRRFPGPAGLLPDNEDSSIPEISYSNSLEESESDRLKDPAESSLSDYCSQNTRNLFVGGAWQLMLNDLPPDFLKGYEIATIKHMANTNCCKSAKVQLLAGMLEHIDHSHENPPIVLKDFTDNIRGIVHRDIPLNYPGILEPNVVLLLHNVGLLRTSGCLVSNSYHVLISPSSLLAIYSKNGRVVCTPEMHAILRKISNGKISENEHAFTKPLIRRPIKAGSEKLGASRKDFLSTSTDNYSSKLEGQHVDKEKQGATFGTSSSIFNSMNESIDFDEESDSLISMCCDEITDSQNERNFASFKYQVLTSNAQQDKKFPGSAKENVQSNDKKETTTLSLMQTLKKFASNTNTVKKLPPSSKTFPSDAERPAASNERDVSSDVSGPEKPLFKEKHASESSILQCDVKPKSPRLEAKDSNVEKVSVRSGLLQFKSKDVLSEPIEDQEGTKNAKSSTQKSSFEDLLGLSDNDSDDEMLSQLDMDMYNNYSKNRETSTSK